MVDTAGMGARGHDLPTSVPCRTCHDPVDRALAVQIEHVPSGIVEYECQGCYFKEVIEADMRAQHG